MVQLLMTSLLIIGMANISSAQTQTHTILNPASTNGYKYYNFRDQGTIENNVQYYRAQTLNCNLVYSCQLLDAYDDVSADSDLNGVCRALGYSSSVSSRSGNTFNPFGKILIFGADGRIDNVITKAGLPLQLPMSDLNGFPPIMYEAVSENVLTSITCQ